MTSKTWCLFSARRSRNPHAHACQNGDENGDENGGSRDDKGEATTKSGRFRDLDEVTDNIANDAIHVRKPATASQR